METQRQVSQARLAQLGLQPGPESQTWQLRGCDVWKTAHKGARSICMHPT